MIRPNVLVFFEESDGVVAAGACSAAGTAVADARRRESTDLGGDVNFSDV